MDFDSTSRFSGRVSDYARYRPSYPEAMVRALAEGLSLVPRSVVADVGSGTGISTRCLLELGCIVYGVEPNDEMRRAAESLLGEEGRFTSLKGTAEDTTLPRASVDAVTAGQAFHWFDAAAARREWSRILRPGGAVGLFWNHRRQSTAFAREYEDVMRSFGIDYEAVKAEWHVVDRLELLFGGPYDSCVFASERLLDANGLRGLVRSASYLPSPEHPRHEPMMREVEQVFARHERSGVVRMEYETRLYYGRLSSAGGGGDETSRTGPA